MRIYSILNSVIQEAILKYFPGYMLLLDKLCKMLKETITTIKKYNFFSLFAM